MRRLSLIAAAFAAMTFIPAGRLPSSNLPHLHPAGASIGTPITLEQAKKVAVAAEAYAARIISLKPLPSSSQAARGSISWTAHNTRGVMWRGTSVAAISSVDHRL